MLSMETRNVRRRAQYANDVARRAYNAEWKKENLERSRESNRRSAEKARAADPEKFRAAYRRHYAKHRDKRIEQTKQWVKKNPGCYLFYNAKRRASALGLPFDLKLADIVIPDICPVLGIPIVKENAARKGFSEPGLPSIDRLIPPKGYVRNNIRIISMRANIIKGNATLEELEMVAAYVRRETAP